MNAFDYSNQIPIPDTALQQLGIFSGRWHVEGENLNSAPQAPDAKVNGEVDYKWMPGAFFMLCNFQRYFEGNQSHIGIGIMGYDSRNDEFFTQNYDNLGYTRIYRLVHEGSEWKFLGDRERGTIRFNEKGNQFTEEWEIASDEGWQPLCKLTAVKFSSYEIRMPER